MGGLAQPPYPSAMDQALGCSLLPLPERGGAFATALPAAPAALPVVHLQVPRRERVPLAAGVGYSAVGRKRVSEQLKAIAEAHDTS